MEMHADFHCFCCHKWLCKKPRACCDKRICDDCYEEIEGDWPVDCPACYEPAVLNVSDHYGLDYVAARQMKEKKAACKVCSNEMLMSDLREHEEKCGEAQLHVPIQVHVHPNENEPVQIECPYHIYGCKYKAGTQADVNQHLQVVPPPITCFRAKLLDSGLRVVLQRHQQLHALMQQIRNIQEQRDRNP